MATELSGRFARFMAQSKAVRFGKFILKSGKESEVFFDFGQICDGHELLALGGFFADFIVERSLHDVDVLFGPAYKGINIAIATSIALHERHNLSIPFAYNRKTEKDHGEKGSFVGYDLSRAESALILDDVISSGATKYEAISMLAPFTQLAVRAMVVGMDRQEVDDKGETYLSLFVKKTGIDMLSITTKEEVLACKKGQ